MGETGDTKVELPASAAALVDELAAQQRVLAAAQARQAALMIEFGQVRRALDARRIADQAAVGSEARYQPGEFAAMEIGLAVTASAHWVQRTVAMAERLRVEAPDAWDAWTAGDIDQLKAVRINRALLRLTRTSSKQLLNALVVPVAACRTAELLGRWLNQFVARVEPDQANERLRRSFADRYVSLRPDLDGMSFLSAALCSVDAVAVDEVLTALAGPADPDDGRTLQQRRADVLVDLLLGRADNCCHSGAREDDGEEDDYEANDGEHHDCETSDHEETNGETGGETGDHEETNGEANRHGDNDGPGPETPERRPWNPEDDWELPASAFRPDRHIPPVPASAAGAPNDRNPPGRRPIVGCTSCRAPGQLAVTVGVVVSVQSLFGYTDTPGQLADRSALVPAGLVRELADRPDTLFYRLLTDQAGNLLQVNELGRFPSRRLDSAVKLRDGICVNPICTVPARRCDLDHVVPAPYGATAAANLDPKCRSDHRARTHAGHSASRDDERHATTWTTPTGHVYTSTDDPLPVEHWPGGDSSAGC